MKKKHKCKNCPWGKDVGGKIFCIWLRCVKKIERTLAGGPKRSKKITKIGG